VRLAGTMADCQESEKLPAGLACILETLEGIGQPTRHPRRHRSSPRDRRPMTRSPGHASKLVMSQRRRERSLAEPGHAQRRAVPPPQSGQGGHAGEATGARRRTHQPRTGDRGSVGFGDRRTNAAPSLARIRCSYRNTHDPSYPLPRALGGVPGTLPRCSSCSPLWRGRRRGSGRPSPRVWYPSCRGSGRGYCGRQSSLGLIVPMHPMCCSPAFVEVQAWAVPHVVCTFLVPSGVLAMIQRRRWLQIRRVSNGRTPEHRPKVSRCPH